MQPLFSFGQVTDLASIRDRLAIHFERIRIAERPDPVSQLVGSFIGTRTHDWRSWEVFVRLVQRYPNWDALADAHVKDIEAAIQGVTYPEKKAPELKQALQVIRARFGKINLDFLAEYDVDQALNCLQKIHGIGPKTAAAILNFSALRMRAFVVDTHVLRVLRRFGFVAMRADAKVAHDAVMAAADDLDADDLFELHWHIKRLGQDICTHAQALCASCPLSDICQRRVGDLATLKNFLEKPELEDVVQRSPLGHGMADLCLRGGLKHGVLHEVIATAGHETATTGFAAGLASRVATDKRVLWVQQDFSANEYGQLSPTGLIELGFDPARLLSLSVTNASDGFRAANDALSCAALGAVVIEIPGNPKAFDLVTSRRLTLGAAQKSVTAFLLRFGAQADASTAETRWQVSAAASQKQNDDWGDPVFEASLIRNRQGKTGHWFMEWNCDGRIFQEFTANHGAMVSAPANRQAEAA
jgi:protein ImuA